MEAFGSYLSWTLLIGFLSRISVEDEKCFEYTLDVRKVFNYHSFDANGEMQDSEIYYYQGRKKDKDKADLVEEVTFIFFTDRDLAARVFNSSKHAKHSRVLQAKFCKYSETIGKHVVCFEKFDGFLPDNDRELSAALGQMHLANLSSSWLHLSLGYVWSEEKLKTLLNDRREGHTDRQWKAILKRNVEFFRCGLDPFLKEDMKDILEIFARVHHALVSKDYGTLKLSTLERLLIYRQLHGVSEYDCTTCGLGRTCLTNLKLFLVRGNYLEGEVKNLLRFLRNVYQHYSEEEYQLKLDDVFKQIKTHWPNFVDRVHECLYS